MFQKLFLIFLFHIGFVTMSLAVVIPDGKLVAHDLNRGRSVSNEYLEVSTNRGHFYYNNYMFSFNKETEKYNGVAHEASINVYHKGQFVASGVYRLYCPKLFEKIYEIEFVQDPQRLFPQYLIFYPQNYAKPTYQRIQELRNEQHNLVVKQRMYQQQQQIQQQQQQIQAQQQQLQMQQRQIQAQQQLQQQQLQQQQSTSTQTISANFYYEGNLCYVFNHLGQVSGYFRENKRGTYRIERNMYNESYIHVRWANGSQQKFKLSYDKTRAKINDGYRTFKEN